MSNGYAADEPRHVELAQIDEDVRAMAIEGARKTLIWSCESARVGFFDTKKAWPEENTSKRARIDLALRVLRHYGLLVEHGDGIVSVKEKANYEKS